MMLAVVKAPREVLAEIKTRFGKPADKVTFYPSTYVLTDGTVLAMGTKESQNYGHGYSEHRDFDTYIESIGGTGTLMDYDNALRLATRVQAVELPPQELSTAQYRLLENWLQDIRSYHSDEPLVTIGGAKHCWNYNLSYDKVTNIIGRVRQYYRNGKLSDSVWPTVERLVKTEFGITRVPPQGASYILPDGSYLDLERWFREYNGTAENDYEDQAREDLYKGIERGAIDWSKIQPGSFAMHSLVQYFINMKMFGDGGEVDTGQRLHDDDDAMMQNGCIKINSGETLYDSLYTNLPASRPTNTALKTLGEYIFWQFYRRRKKAISIFVEGKSWAEAKYERDDYPDSNEIIEKIRMYYVRGRLEK